MVRNTIVMAEGAVFNLFLKSRLGFALDNALGTVPYARVV